jgi:hypothetical protein
MVQGQAGRQAEYGKSDQGRVAQDTVTWRGDSAGEDGCLRGRDPWDPCTADSTGQVRSGQESMDAMRTRHRPKGPRWMHAYRAALTCCQPDSRATIPRIPERNRNKYTVSEENLASHTYRRSVQEAHAIRDPYALHTPHDNSIR